MTRENNPRRITPPGGKSVPPQPVRLTRTTSSKTTSSGSSGTPVDKQVEAVRNPPKERIAESAAEKQLAEVTARLQKVLAENRTLTSAAGSTKIEIEQLRRTMVTKQKETEQLQRTAAAAQKEAARASSEAASSEKRRIEAENKVKDLEAEINRLQRQAAESAEKDPLKSLKQVNPAQVTDMISEFEQTLSGSLSGLTVQNVELKLKIAVLPSENNELRIVPVISGIDLKDRDISEFVVRLVPSLR